MPIHSDYAYSENQDSQKLVLQEQGIEEAFMERLCSLKYEHRPDIRDRASP